MTQEHTFSITQNELNKFKSPEEAYLAGWLASREQLKANLLGDEMVQAVAERTKETCYVVESQQYGHPIVRICNDDGSVSFTKDTSKPKVLQSETVRGLDDVLATKAAKAALEAVVGEL